MKLAAITAAVLFTLCGPALAGPAPRIAAADPRAVPTRVSAPDARMPRAAATPPGPATPAIAAPPVRDAHKLHVTLRDTATQTFDLVVGAASSCADAAEKHTDRQLQVHVCLIGNALDLQWSTHSAWGEFQSTSSVPFAAGTTAELGTTSGPRLSVTM